MRRNTIQNKLILEEVNKLQSHPTADTVYESIVRTHPTISRATVYRNLNQLSEDGELSKIEVPDGPNHFDHITKEHYHVRCTQCGRLFDVDMDPVDLEKNIKDPHGFKFTGHNLTFDGICPECNKG